MNYEVESGIHTAQIAYIKSLISQSTVADLASIPKEVSKVVKILQTATFFSLQTIKQKI